MGKSPSELNRDTDRLRHPARQARNVLQKIQDAAAECKDGEDAVTAGRRLERIHAWAEEARELLSFYNSVKVRDEGVIFPEDSEIRAP